MNKDALKIDVQEIESCRKEVKVEVPRKQVKEAFESTLSTLKTRVNLPGFRPGRAPKALILKKFNKEVEDQVRQDIFRAVMETMFDDEKTSPISQPEINQGTISSDADFSFSMKYDVEPTIDLPDYKNLEVESSEFELDDNAIEQQLEEIRERHSKLGLVERAAEEEDFVKCTFDAEIDVEDDSEVPEAAWSVLKGEGRWIPVKTQSLLPNALAGLKGKKAGEEAIWEATFEDAHPVEFLRGKTVTYNCKIDEVHGRIIPELDDELAKQAGAESLEDLRVKLADSEKAKHEDQETAKNKQVVLDQLLSGFDCELPPTVLKAEVSRHLHTLKHEKNLDHDCNDHDHRHDEDCGHSEEQIKIETELQEEAEQIAKRELKKTFLLHKIAKVEEVKVEDYELQYHVYMMAHQMRVDPETFLKQIEKNGSINRFKEQILNDKTLGKVVQLCLVKEEPVEEIKEK